MTILFMHKDTEITEETAADDYLKWLEDDAATGNEGNRNGWQRQASSFLQASEPQYRHF